MLERIARNIKLISDFYNASKLDNVERIGIQFNSTAEVKGSTVYLTLITEIAYKDGLIVYHIDKHPAEYFENIIKERSLPSRHM